MLTVKRQWSRSFASGARFPVASGDASRVALREVSSAFWNMALHREFDNRLAGSCRLVSGTTWPG